MGNSYALSARIDRLEPRRLLAGIDFDPAMHVVTITGSAGADVVSVQETADGTRFVVNQAELTVPAAALGQTPTIIINALGGDDDITISSLTQEEDVVEVDAGAGRDLLTVFGHAAGDDIATFDFAPDFGLIVQAGELITAVQGIGLERLDISALGGNDSISNSKLAGIEELNIDAGEGNDRISLGAPASAAQLIQVRPGAGTDALDFSDDSDVPRAYTVRGGVIRVPDFVTVFFDAERTETARIFAGAGNDSFAVATSPTVSFEINGGESDSAADRLSVLNAGATGLNFTNDGDGAGTFRFADRQPISFGEIEVVDPVDTVAPTVVDFAFAFDREQAITVRFSEDVSQNLDLGDVLLLNTTTNQMIPWNQFTLTIDSAPGAPTVATWRPIGVLPDGDYIATLARFGTLDASLNPLPAEVTRDFFVLAGDANHDHIVNFDDYVQIDNGFNRHLSGFANGDFNYDGVVNFDDYVIIDLAFNH